MQYDMATHEGGVGLRICFMLTSSVPAVRKCDL